MSENFTKEEVEKAIEQADANLELEEVILPGLVKDEEKPAKKVLKK